MIACCVQSEYIPCYEIGVTWPHWSSDCAIRRFSRWLLGFNPSCIIRNERARPACYQNRCINFIILKWPRPAVDSHWYLDHLSTQGVWNFNKSPLIANGLQQACTVRNGTIFFGCRSSQFFSRLLFLSAHHVVCSSDAFVTILPPCHESIIESALR